MVRCRQNSRYLLLVGVLLLSACAAQKPKEQVEAPVVLRPVIVAERGADEMKKAIDLIATKNYLQAEVNLEEIVKVRADIAEAHFNLAWVKQQLGKHEEVLSHVANGLKLRPNEVSALLMQALSERELGKFGEAEATYKMGLQLAPNDDRLYFNLGILYDLYLFRPAEAMAQYRRYLALQTNPNPKVERWVVALERSVSTQNGRAPTESIGTGENRK